MSSNKIIFFILILGGITGITYGVSKVILVALVLNSIWPPPAIVLFSLLVVSLIVLTFSSVKLLRFASVTDHNDYVSVGMLIVAINLSLNWIINCINVLSK